MSDVQTVEVPVKDPWWSKINWTVIVGAAASGAVVLSGGKLDISPEMQVQLVAGIQALVSVIVVICRTWLNNTATSSVVLNK